FHQGFLNGQLQLISPQTVTELYRRLASDRILKWPQEFNCKDHHYFSLCYAFLQFLAHYFRQTQVVIG
ncbi:MAG: hypothetical protein JXR71_09415, partial [Bacteroidales bacterium]|nr:hypothetical protein [Bacteroidales bacterium]